MKKVNTTTIFDVAKYNAIDIARWFIMRSKNAEDYEGGDKLSLLKLLKLLYYAEGSFLAIKNRDLFFEPVIAWAHGPVEEGVWKQYNEDLYNLPYGSDDDIASINKISSEDKELLEGVFQTFNKYSAWGLRDKTHKEDPWKITTNDGEELNKEIPKELIKEYFLKHYVSE